MFTRKWNARQVCVIDAVQRRKDRAIYPCPSGNGQSAFPVTDPKSSFRGTFRRTSINHRAAKRQRLHRCRHNLIKPPRNDLYADFRLSIIKKTHAYGIRSACQKAVHTVKSRRRMQVKNTLFPLVIVCIIQPVQINK